MNIKTSFDIKDKVYLVTDPDQNIGLITGIILRSIGITYEVSMNGECYECFDFELSIEKQVI